MKKYKGGFWGYTLSAVKYRVFSFELTTKQHTDMSYTEGLELAIEFGMEELYTELVENGATPLQAIMEWN